MATTIAPTQNTMDTDTRFWDQIAEKYSKQPIRDQETYEKKLALTWEHVPANARVLEFGCGTGSTALLHAGKFAEVLATDISPGMIEIAEKKLAETDLTNLSFATGTVFDIEESESFDAVLGLNILHLMDDWKEGIEKAYALLKPGGLFITSTPMLNQWWLKLAIPVMRFFGKAPTVIFIDQADYESTLAAAGFEEVARLDPPKGFGSLFTVMLKP